MGLIYKLECESFVIELYGPDRSHSEFQAVILIKSEDFYSALSHHEIVSNENGIICIFQAIEKAKEKIKEIQVLELKINENYRKITTDN